MERFFEVVSQLSPLSAEGKQALADILQYHEVPKGYLLARAGTICNHLYFVESGLTRTYYIKDEKDVTDWLSSEDSFACSVISFISRTPDRRIIETLEPSVLWSLQYYELEQLCARYHDVEHFVRSLLSFGMIRMQKRFDDLHFATAAGRYNELMQTAPALIQRVPLGILASYLGMTQETLSRIRARL